MVRNIKIISMKLYVFLMLLTSVLVSYLTQYYITYSSQSSKPFSLESLRKAACNSAVSFNTKESHCFDYRHPGRDSCKLAFGFAAVQDVIVSTHHILKSLPAPSKALYHSEITNKQQFLETFADHFSRGAAAEFRIPKVVFEELLILLNSVPVSEDIGGNASIMAFRAGQEGCKAYLSSPLTLSLLDYFPSGLSLLNPLVDKADIHLVLEYKEGEKWGSFRAPRTNRFYLNHDIENLKVDVLRGLNEIEPDSVDMYIFGGLQLIQNLDYKEFLANLVKLNQKARNSHKPTHVELADFQNPEFYDDLIKLAKDVDSVGLNEQELGKLLAALKGEKFTGYPSKPSLSPLIHDSISLLTHMKQKGAALTRLHVHSIISQIICSTDSWSNPIVPSARSALLATQLACNSTDIQQNDIHIFEGVVDLPIEDTETSIWNVSINELSRCWDADFGFRCCASVVPTCLNPVTTRALGDNISSMGLVYHNLKNNSILII